MKVALVGNQNSGKTTLFNLLTGMNAKIGNWPGVTIEKKSGKLKNTDVEIIDLPGIYSLSPYSEEEEISRKFIFDEKPDVIINIIDSTVLERSLYLTTQLIELDIKVIVALNMADELEKKGIKIDIKKLENKLDAKIIKISALKATGIDDLISEIKKNNKIPTPKIFDERIEYAIENIYSKLPSDLKHKRFIAIRLLELDERFRKINSKDIEKIINNLAKKYEEDLEEVIATKRYRFIEDVKKVCFKQGVKKESISNKLDKIFLNKWLAFPIFVAIMFLVYNLSIGVVGRFTVDRITNFVDSAGNVIEDFLNDINTSNVLTSLIVDGIITGVGAVLSFVPQLIILFTCISLLETTGYMSRISLLLDKVFRKIGLSGKSLIPFIVGSGCSVPGIMSTRIIENQDEREMTTILTPFIPCSAKLPIISLFAGFFFPQNSAFVSVSLYFLAIIIIIVSTIIMRKFIYKNTTTTYISELPKYKLPSIKYVAKDVLDRSTAFIKRAGSVILICSIIIWFLVSFSFDMTYGVNIEDSILAFVGNKISWVFEPMLGTKSWGAAVSTIQGLVAKEQVVSSMAVINGLADDVEEGSKIFSENGMFGFFTASSAYAFMVFNLFSAPCFGAIGAMKRELGGIAKLFKVILVQTIFAWLLATIIYQVGIRLETGILNMTDIFVLVGIVVFVIAVIIKVNKNKNCTGCPYVGTCENK